MDETVKTIVESLTKKTKEKKAKWLESSTKSEYKILFNSATVLIGLFKDTMGKSYYLLRILNDEGRVIIRESAFLTQSSSELLKALHLAAQDSCLKKKDTLDSILSQLNGDVVGISKKEE